MTTKAPETIWAITTEVTGAVVTGAWADTVRALPRGIDPPEYVRADLCAAVVAERDALRAKLAEAAERRTYDGTSESQSPEADAYARGREDALAEAEAERDNWRESSKRMTEFYEHRGRLLEHETARAEAAEAALATAREGTLREAAEICGNISAGTHDLSAQYKLHEAAVAILALIERKP